MFFKRHLKQGEELGQITLQMLASISIGSKFEEYGRFIPPHGFFSDSYVVGFLTTYCSLLMGFALGGNSWSKQKKGECISKALLVIDPSGELYNGLLKRIPLNENEVANGNHDATTVMGLTYNKLRPEDTDPKVTEAREIAADLNRVNNTSIEANLASAALIVTIRRYLHSKWI